MGRPSARQSWQGEQSAATAKVKRAKVKGALLDKVTNLVVVLFGVSLVAERLVL